jgi:Na+/H+-dicarboxylate symporter
MKLKLHWQILIAMALAWLFYLVVGESSRIVEQLGVVFIRLLKMIIIPLVVLSIITGVARVGNSNLKGLKYKISAEDSVKIKDAGHA